MLLLFTDSTKDCFPVIFGILMVILTALDSCATGQKQQVGFQTNNGTCSITTKIYILNIKLTIGPPWQTHNEVWMPSVTPESSWGSMIAIQNSKNPADNFSNWRDFTQLRSQTQSALFSRYVCPYGVLVIVPVPLVHARISVNCNFMHDDLIIKIFLWHRLTKPMLNMRHA